jgi:hypothetical protein
VSKKGGIDKHLLDALTRAYTARARLFHESVQASGIDLLIAEIDGIGDQELSWNPAELGISKSALGKVRESGAKPHATFAHPDVLAARPHLVAYYRNLATISSKGIGQILFPTGRYESRRTKQMPPGDAARLCRVLNKILSGVIDAAAHYSPEVSRDAILAEIGAQLQGTWVNRVGQGASREVEEVLRRHIEVKGLGRRAPRRRYQLNNGWQIAFASEPDVAFCDAKQIKRIAIEIKGSLDVAGAQTRYGEALKSFRKQLADNPRCHTIYLASCFTDAVIAQIKADGQVRDWYNLTSILSDEKEREHFLRRLFHIVKTPA